MNQFERSAMEKAIFGDAFDMYKLSIAASNLQDPDWKKIGTFPGSRVIIRFNHAIIIILWE